MGVVSLLIPFVLPRPIIPCIFFHFGFCSIIFWVIGCVVILGCAADFLLLNRLVVKKSASIKSRIAAKKSRIAAEKSRIAAEQAHRREQKGYYDQMIVLGNESLSHFELIPEDIRGAELFLDQAEKNFSENAFAPFWDSIQYAAMQLADFDNRSQKIEENSSKYENYIKKYEDKPPQFPLAHTSIKKLTMVTTTAKRMQSIVRTAQRDFQFASIYEQRKTNQVLISGFTTLGQALDSMTWKITGSIDNLAGSVNSIHSTLSRHHDETMRAESGRHNEIKEIELDRATREKKVLKMLDNIQHRRKPPPFL